MRHIGAFVLAGVAGLGISQSAFAQGGTNFAGAVVYGPGTATGSFTPGVSSETLFLTLSGEERVADTVNDHLITGLNPGAGVRAEMVVSGSSPTWDSYMRLRNSANTTTLFSDDDDGEDYMSAMLPGETVTAPVNGEIRVQITGYDDRNTFIGTNDSSNTGFYDLNIYQIAITTPGVSVQWYRFEGIGGAISADVTAPLGFSDSMLMLFDSSGNILGADDDDGPGLLSSIVPGDGIIAPGDGVVYAAVTYYNFNDYLDQASYDNREGSTQAGSFSLTLVPAPGAAGLLGLGGLIALRRRRA